MIPLLIISDRLVAYSSRWAFPSIFGHSAIPVQAVLARLVLAQSSNRLNILVNSESRHNSLILAIFYVGCIFTFHGFLTARLSPHV